MFILERRIFFLFTCKIEGRLPLFSQTKCFFFQNYKKTADDDLLLFHCHERAHAYVYTYIYMSLPKYFAWMEQNRHVLKFDLHFRSYPGPWKVLRRVRGRYICLHQQEEMPSLKQVALDILPLAWSKSVMAVCILQLQNFQPRPFVYNHHITLKSF